jgi:hypothetical protein
MDRNNRRNDDAQQNRRQIHLLYHWLKNNPPIKRSFKKMQKTMRKVFSIFLISTFVLLTLSASTKKPVTKLHLFTETNIPTSFVGYLDVVRNSNSGRMFYWFFQRLEFFF